MSENYKGPERRRESNWINEDRDLLIRVNQNVENLISLYKDHVQNDERQFIDFGKRINSVERLIFMGIGIFLVLEVGIKILVK